MVPLHLQGRPSVWAASLALTCSLAGCGGSAAAARSALEARLQELQQENQGLRAQLAEATEDAASSRRSCDADEGDRERSASRGGKDPGGSGPPSDRPELQVVRLVPPGTGPESEAARGRPADEPVSASALEAAEPDSQEDAGAARPVLRLRGSEEPKLQPLDNAATRFGATDSSRTKP